jgi:inosine-uridine nucleoside N-ribohydrolase
VAVGPLTNLALALLLEPELPRLVRRVVVMGGAVAFPGNISPVAEANIFKDPEAAASVLGAGWPVTLVGLDVTMRTVMSADYLEALERCGTPAARLVGQIVPVYLRSYRERYGLDGIPTHDPSAMAWAIAPALFRAERLPVHVETQGRCAGQTVVDWRRQWEDLPPVEVCLEVDSDRLLGLFHERLSAAD